MARKQGDRVRARVDAPFGSIAGAEGTVVVAADNSGIFYAEFPGAGHGVFMGQVGDVYALADEDVE